MSGLRALLIALIAISIGIAPIIEGAGVSVASIEMSMPDDANMPCCPPADSKASFVCSVKCFNFAGALFPTAILLPEISDPPALLFVDETLIEHVISPAHPPPI